MVGDGAPLLIHHSAHGHPLLAAAERAGWRVESASHTMDKTNAALFVAMDATQVHRLRELCPDALAIGGEDFDSVDLVVPLGAADSILSKVLSHALQIRELHRAARTNERDLEVRRRRTRQLADIGIALSTQRDPTLLLETILSEARRLAGCDAGSLYLIDETDGVRGLCFKLAQNDTAAVSFQETRLPVTAGSLSGYVALTGRELNIADAYEIPCDRAISVQSVIRRAGWISNAIDARSADVGSQSTHHRSAPIHQPSRTRSGWRY